MDITHDIPYNDITMDVTNGSVTHPHIITHFISHLPQYAVDITDTIFHAMISSAWMFLMVL